MWLNHADVLSDVGENMCSVFCNLNVVKFFEFCCFGEV